MEKSPKAWISQCTNKNSRVAFTGSLVAQLVKNPPAMQETPVWFLGQENPLEKRIGYPLQYSWASLVAQLAKNLPAMRETWVQSLGWEDPLEKGKATPLQYSGLENSMDYIVHGVAESDTTERLSLSHLATERSLSTICLPLYIICPLSEVLFTS